MLPAMRSPMRRSADADNSELSPSVGNEPEEPEALDPPTAPDERFEEVAPAAESAPCVKAAGLAASAATSSHFLERIIEVNCIYPGGLNTVANMRQAHMMTND